MNKSNPENKPIDSKTDSTSSTKIISDNEKSAIQSNGTSTATKSVPVVTPNNVPIPISAPVPIPVQSPASASAPVSILSQHSRNDNKIPEHLDYE